MHDAKSLITILVIDKDPACRRCIKGALAPDYVVVEAERGADAMNAITPSVALVLVNHTLPDIDGIVFCRLLKQRTARAMPQLLLMVKTVQASLVAEAFDAGCSDFVSKPINVAELQVRVSNVLKLKQWRDSQDLLISDLRERSEKDPLTHLYNRHVFRDYGTREIARAMRSRQSLSLLMIDIDDFKAINVAHGHPVGDSILVRLSDLMLKQLRHYDIVVRHGGDEFVVLLPSTPKQAASHVANKLWDVVRHARFPTKKGIVTITVSIGVGEWKGTAQQRALPEEILEHLLSTADHNLRLAKKNGRNQVVASEVVTSPHDTNYKAGVFP